MSAVAKSHVTLEYENLLNYIQNRREAGAGDVDLAASTLSMGINLLVDLGMTHDEVGIMLKAAALVVDEKGRQPVA